MHRRLSTTTAKGNTVVSATAALGAVVTGGLLASQATGISALVDVADAGHPDTSTLAVASGTPLQLQPAGHEAPLSPSDMADANVVTAILPIAGARDASLDQRDVESLHKGEELAQQASATHAAAVREASILNGGGGLDDWINVALSKLGLDQSLAGSVKSVIMKESRGNPHAVNRWDSNAMAGRPSQGLMQVIPSTFRSYVLPELAGRPITDPVANITAGIRYMIANYGLGTLKAGGRYSRGSYVGY
jgi:Transglycosylase SLT domain